MGYDGRVGAHAIPPGFASLFLARSGPVNSMIYEQLVYNLQTDDDDLISPSIFCVIVTASKLATVPSRSNQLRDFMFLYS